MPDSKLHAKVPNAVVNPSPFVKSLTDRREVEEQGEG
jgi:hypothetical protein